MAQTGILPRARMIIDCASRGRLDLVQVHGMIIMQAISTGKMEELQKGNTVMLNKDMTYALLRIIDS
jgi:hypothetical protein